MKVWICNPFDFLPGEGARLQRYALLMQAFALQGDSVLWWSADWNHLSKQRRIQPALQTLRTDLRLTPEHGHIEIRLLPTRPYFKNISFRRLWSHHQWIQSLGRALRNEPSKPDVIITSSPPLGVWQQVRDMGIPVIIDVMDNWPENFITLFPKMLRPLGKCLLAPMQKTAQDAYRHAYGVTGATGQYASTTNRADFKTFPLGITLPPWKPDLSTQASYRLVYVGNLGESYLFAPMIQGMRHFLRSGIPLHLDIIGDGPAKRIFREAEAERLPITLHGLVTPARYEQLMQNADIGIIPMQGEMGVGMPNKLFDYAAYGLAILNGLTGETAQKISKAGAGRNYHVQSPLSFAENLETLIREGLLPYKQKSRHLAETEFNAQKIYSQMAEWIQSRIQTKQ